jgi:hypothetical protein
MFVGRLLLPNVQLFASRKELPLTGEGGIARQNPARATTFSRDNVRSGFSECAGENVDSNDSTSLR